MLVSHKAVHIDAANNSGDKVWVKSCAIDVVQLRATKTAARGRQLVERSGLFASRDQSYGLDELVPGLALSRQHALTCRRQPIEPPSSLACLLDPRSLDPSAFLEAIEQRIERVEMETSRPPDWDSISLPSS